MKSVTRVALVLLLLPALLAAQTAKKKPSTPAAFRNARYAWVEAFNGDAFTPRVVPEDRQAIADVEDALRDWSRYSLTTSRSQADLVFIVRKGRIASATLGGTVGAGTGPVNRPVSSQGPISDPVGNGGGIGVGTEVGSPDDILEVHTLNPDGTLGIVLWERSFPDGLDAPQVTLIAQLKKAVERDYPQNPPPAKP
jgi:hypothetical protein